MDNRWFGTQRELRQATSRPNQADVAGARRMPWPALDQVLQVGVVAVMTAAAAALLVTHQAPSHAGHNHKPAHVAAVGSAPTVLQPHHATLVEAVNPHPKAGPVADALSSSLSRVASPTKVTAPVRLPVSVVAPAIVSKPLVSGIPQVPLGA
jgi:hypothetical protein